MFEYRIPNMYIWYIWFLNMIKYRIVLFRCYYSNSIRLRIQLFGANSKKFEKFE